MAVNTVLAVDHKSQIVNSGLDTTEQFLDNAFKAVFDWAKVPGTNVRFGIAGRVGVTGGTVTLRIRTGATNPLDSASTGTERLSVSAPSGTNDLGVWSASTTKPTGLNYSRLTAQSASTSTATCDGLATLIEVDGSGSYALLNSDPERVISGSLPETVMKEWVFDFDRLGGSGTSVDVTLALSTVVAAPTPGQIRLRVGGTQGGVNGTSIGTMSVTNQAGVGLPQTINGVIARPSGPQPVKLTMDTSTSGDLFLRDVTVLIKAA